VPAGLPTLSGDSGEACSIDAWLIQQPSRTVLIPVTGDSMIEAGIHGVVVGLIRNYRR